MTSRDPQDHTSGVLSAASQWGVYARRQATKVHSGRGADIVMVQRR
jgi:hypothetical protein